MTGRTDPPDPLTEIEQRLNPPDLLTGFNFPRAEPLYTDLADLRWPVAELRATREELEDLAQIAYESNESEKRLEAELAAAHQIIQLLRVAMHYDDTGSWVHIYGHYKEPNPPCRICRDLAAFDANHPAPK